MKNENRTERVSARVTKDLKDRVEEKARKENRTVANYIQNLILEDLEKEKDKE